MEIEISDTIIVSKVLATLSEEYAHFASAWDSTDTGKTLKNLTARLIAEEMRIETRNKEKKEVTFTAAGKKCFKCNKSYCKNRYNSKYLPSGGRQSVRITSV